MSNARLLAGVRVIELVEPRAAGRTESELSAGMSAELGGTCASLLESLGASVVRLRAAEQEQCWSVGGALVPSLDLAGAAGRQQLVFYPASGEPPRLTIYDDDFTRQDDRWRFRRRTCRFLNADGVLRPRP